MIQVDLAVIGDHPIGPGIDSIPVGDVEVLRRDLDAEALALRHRLGEARVVDVAERQVRTPPSERTGERPPDARTGPGDGRNTSGEVLSSVLPPPFQAPTRLEGLVGRTAGPENSMMESSMSLIFRAR